MSRDAGLLIVLALVAAVPAFAAEPPPSGRVQSGRPAPVESSGSQPVPLGSLISATGFVVAMAHAAGAQEACDSPAARSLRLCIEFILPRWHDITGQAVPAARESASFPVVWRHAFMTANTVQITSPPLSCAEVSARVAALPIWAQCGMAPHPGARSAPMGMPPAGSRAFAIPNGSPG